MSELRSYDMLIDGQWRPSASGKYFDAVNPYTGKTWAKIPHGDETDVDSAVKAAHRAFSTGAWSAASASARGVLLRNLGDLIARDAEELARIEVCDNGKLFTEMLGQMRYLPQWFYYYGGLADKIEGTVVPVDKPDHFTYTRLEPAGVVAAITPWNSPLLLAGFKIAPALAAGNTIVLKPSEYTSASALAFGRLFEEAGFPPGVFNVVTGAGADTGQALVSHPKVAKVAFTGGEAGGQSVYQNAAASFKSVVLELGGKSPNIVFEDSNLENAAFGAIAGIFAASGQTCIAGSRLLVQNSIYDEFVSRIVEIAKRAKIGDPMDVDTNVGPVTTSQQFDKILRYIEIAKSEGATCVLGGKQAAGDNLGAGQFIEPTIFTEVTNNMRIAREEVFGPVLSVIRFDTEDEAVAIANDSDYGLAAGIWTENLSRALRVEKALQVGTVWINTYRALSYMMPFGGVKRSGLGRENGLDAIKEFMHAKSVWINTSAKAVNPFQLR